MIIQGDFPVREYFIERDPRVNIWGAGFKLINDQNEDEISNLDMKYLIESDTFKYDLIFYVVKTYYYDNENKLKNEGCPALLLSEGTKACQLGTGITAFDSTTAIKEETIASLQSEPSINYENFKNDSLNLYEREGLFNALDQCIIGRKFRLNQLEIPDDKTEQDVQPVYLIQTKEGGLVKFMVKQFKGPKPNEKQTLIRWQVIKK